MLSHFTSLGSGPIVLMLHGAGGGFRTFAPQVESLAAMGYRAVAWDMPGYGLSLPVQPFGLKGLAQRAVALIESLLPPDAPTHQRKVDLIGHGLGGMVAQELVMRRPDLVRRLVLVGSTSGPDSGWAQDAQQQLATMPGDLHGEALTAWADGVIAGQIGPLALTEGVQLARHCLAQVSPVIYRLALQAQAGFDRDAALAQIHVPTLLITGECDRLAPGTTLERMARQIQGSRWVQMPGIGHWPHLEMPDAYEALVLDFLQSAPPTLLH